jgi:hypothetical protein
MPENQNPATKSAPEAAAGEFNFTKPETENPRIKRRSLKAKPAGLIKPAAAALPAARELEREAPPLSSEPATKPAAAQPKAAPAAKVTAVAPPRVTPTVAASTASASKTATTPSTTPAAGPASSPHGTRPATLYYTNNTSKAETSSPMKTIPSASPAPSTSSASSSVTTTPVSSARPAATATSRSAPNVDYRANVERQSREQKSVGSILSYIVYGFIALFVLTVGLAGYGADIIFKQLHDQSATVSDLDAHYTKITTDLNTKLSATQDTLTQAQAQIARQQDLIVKQQEDLNRLIAASSDNDSAIKSERQARAQDTGNLRARVKELEVRESEYRNSIQKY